MAILIEECLEVTFVGPFNRLITDKHFQSRASSGIKKKISHRFGFCSRNERFFNYIFVYKLQKKIDTQKEREEEEMTVTVRERERNKTRTRRIVLRH